MILVPHYILQPLKVKIMIELNLLIGPISLGHQQVVDWLLLKGVAPNPKDRHGNTPKDEAERYGHAKIVKILQEAEDDAAERRKKAAKKGAKKKTNEGKEKEAESDYSDGEEDSHLSSETNGESDFISNK